MSRWRTTLAFDADAKAVEVYRANMPGVEVRWEPVRASTLPRADVLLGGPPCQPFSVAGKRGGSEDDRDCVPDFIDAIGVVRPRMFLMEQVPGFTTFENGRYMQRCVAAMEAHGYSVEMRLLDAVHYGVPQCRLRAWFWGVRRDLPIVRRWPRPTHAWPVPDGECMFGGDLLPAVTVGQALGLDGVYDARNDNVLGPDRPCGTILGNAQATGGGAGHYAIQSHADPARGVDEPAQTLRSGGNGHDGCCVRMIGGIQRLVGRSIQHTKPVHGIDEPSLTITDSQGTFSGVGIHEYRWSDAMLQKHPPASPASPAPTVQAKWFKGGAEGLVEIDTKQKRTRRSVDAPALAGDSRHTLNVRRLTVDEVARLQSMPDDWVWPESVAKTHRYRVVGNGWACLLAKRLGEAFAESDSESETVVDLFCGGGLGAVGWHGRAWQYTADAKEYRA